MKEMKEANEEIKWTDREPYAFWKGNPLMGRNRHELLKCNMTNEQDWNARIYTQAQTIGKASSDFFQEEVKMDFVYDYMLHVLTEYAKLLRYKPTIPEKATEFCLESMACPAPTDIKKLLLDSMEKSTSDAEPCKLPPPFTPEELQQLHEKKAIAVKQVEMWVQKTWGQQGHKF
ncbi:hypothetical protein BHE74_00051951 [Ensete ventricosum]|nr:hypothetical protein GW17_00018475 [Ensete ventricosum]RWW42499.1 hypothetical protein BHE74_00051951 [Ensete ventricosum]